MSIIRSKRKRNPFVMIDKTPLHDRRLSWDARGLMGYLLTKPDNWEIQIGDLVNQSEPDGKTIVQSALKELESAGYIVRRRRKNPETGRFDGWETLVFETPEDREEWELENQIEGAPTEVKNRNRSLPTSGLPTIGFSDVGETTPLINKESLVINEGVIKDPPLPPQGATSDFDRKFKQRAEKAKQGNIYHPELFQHWWKKYMRICRELESNSGKRVEAESAWDVLMEEGANPIEINKGLTLYAVEKREELKQRGKAYVLHGCRFLSQKVWRDAIDRAEVDLEIQQEQARQAESAANSVIEGRSELPHWWRSDEEVEAVRKLIAEQDAKKQKQNIDTSSNVDMPTKTTGLIRGLYELPTEEPEWVPIPEDYRRM